MHHNICDVTGLTEIASAGAPGLYIDGFDNPQSNIVVYSNIIRNCRSGIALVCEAGGTLNNVKVFNNLSYNNTRWGISIESLGSLQDIYIYNNTTWGNGKSGGIILQNNTATNVVIANNIFGDTTGVPIYMAATVEHPENYIITYNLLRRDLEDTATPLGTNYIIGDPLFTNTATGDFTLQPNSPAIYEGRDYWTQAVCNLGVY